jgi:cbb3-type cytochrome oxidase subunit 3
MMGLIDVLERVAPRLEFYPGWARALFTVTFVVFVVALVVFVALYPRAQRATRAESTADHA